MNVINTISDAVLADGGTWEEAISLCRKLENMVKTNEYNIWYYIPLDMYHGESEEFEAGSFHKNTALGDKVNVDSKRVLDPTISELMAALPKEIKSGDLIWYLTVEGFSDKYCIYWYQSQERLECETFKNKHLILAVADALIWCHEKGCV